MVSMVVRLGAAGLVGRGVLALLLPEAPWLWVANSTLALRIALLPWGIRTFKNPPVVTAEAEEDCGVLGPVTVVESGGKYLVTMPVISSIRW
jgi:hypothetical protein